MDWTGPGRSRVADVLWPRMSLPVINLDRIIDAGQSERRLASPTKLITCGNCNGSEVFLYAGYNAFVL